MNSTKGIGGVMMLILGLCLLFFVFIINSGHTSSVFSTGEYIAYTLGGIILIAGGIYAFSTFNKKD